MPFHHENSDPSVMDPAEELEALSLSLAFGMGWTNHEKYERINSKVEVLGEHAISQAVKIITANPLASIQSAAMDFLRTGNTDELAFLGVERWTHRTLITTVRELGDGQRYAQDDFLQASPEVLYEARAIVGIGNLCLSGALRNGSDSADEVGTGWGLTDTKIIELIQRHPFKGDEIIKVMTQQETCNVERVEYVMGITAPLLDGVL
jgi:hypothetical protein